MSKVIETILGPFNSELAEQFNHTYLKNLGRETFWARLSDGFEHEINTNFAKYFVEFLTNHGLLL